MEYTVKVTRKGGTADGWIVQCFAWKDQNDPNPQRVPLIFERDEDDYFAECDLPPGLYSIVSDLIMGVEIEVGMTPETTIIQPSGQEWPVTHKVPATQTRDIFPIYFEVEQQS
ncbi:MAG: hypothetical protein AAF687_03930 [Pseudomonadota bacterium]